ncbi:MAG: hypothetical protein AAB315_06985, partial [Pseudomonadota bacterium]
YVVIGVGLAITLLAMIYRRRLERLFRRMHALQRLKAMVRRRHARAAARHAEHKNSDHRPVR